MRRIGISAAIALSVVLVLPACDDSRDPVLAPPQTTVFGTWTATVSEVGDTCDDVVPADLNLTVDVEPFDVRHTMKFRDYGAGLNCWQIVVDVDGDVLSSSLGYTSDFDCNPGCRVRVQSQAEFAFAPGGRFTGAESLTYLPMTSECDVPACGFPCTNPIDHVLWEPRLGRGCGFGCTTSYRWEALLETTTAPPPCGP